MSLGHLNWKAKFSYIYNFNNYSLFFFFLLFWNAKLCSKRECQGCRIASETSEASLGCYVFFLLISRGFPGQLIFWFLFSTLCRREESQACWVIDPEQSTSIAKDLLCASHCFRPWGHRVGKPEEAIIIFVPHRTILLILCLCSARGWGACEGRVVSGSSLYPK